MNEREQIITRVIRFLSREGECGYGFCVVQDQRLIPQLNEQVTKALPDVEVLYLERDLGVIKQLTTQTQNHRTPLIVANLFELVANTKLDTLQELNFGREAIQRLNIPIIFWVTTSLLSELSNAAPDFFSQRQLSTLYLNTDNTYGSDPDFAPLIKTSFEDLLSKKQRYSEQLEEAIQKKLDDQVIAEEYVLPLIETTVRIGDTETALALLDRWQRNFNLKNLTTLIALGAIYNEIEKPEKALKYLNLTRQIDHNVKYNLSEQRTLSWKIHKEMGEAYQKLNNFPKALYHFEESTHSLTEIKHRDLQGEEIGFLASSFERIGNLYETQHNFNDALYNYEIARQTIEEAFSRYPDNRTFKQYLNFIFKRIADTLYSHGNLTDALRHLEVSTKLDKEFLQESPKDFFFTASLCRSYLKTARAYIRLGNLNLAEKFCRKTLALLEANPEEASSGEYLYIFAISNGELGHIYEDMNLLDRALAYFKIAQVATNTYVTEMPLGNALEYKTRLESKISSIEKKLDSTI